MKNLSSVQFSSAEAQLFFVDLQVAHSFFCSKLGFRSEGFTILKKRSVYSQIHRDNVAIGLNLSSLPAKEEQRLLIWVTDLTAYDNELSKSRVEKNHRKRIQTKYGIEQLEVSVEQQAIIVFAQLPNPFLNK